jgi:hypothetical protein
MGSLIKELLRLVGRRVCDHEPRLTLLHWTLASGNSRRAAIIGRGQTPLEVLCKVG